LWVLFYQNRTKLFIKVDICDCDFGTEHHRMVNSGHQQDFVFFESGSGDNDTETGHPYNDICNSYEKYNLAKHYLIFISLVRRIFIIKILIFFRACFPFSRLKLS